jgi:hypothetical protein
VSHRCSQKRRRSQRRMILCPEHGCYLESASPKYPLFADQPQQLQARGVARLNAQLLLSQQTAVSLQGEWLECFWCTECQNTCWYHVRRSTAAAGGGRCRYDLSRVPPELWQRSTGTIHPMGNPSVGEFTRRQSRMVKYNQLSDFQFM